MPDPQVKQIEKAIEQEEKTDQKNLNHAISDLKNASKAAAKSHTDTDKAHHQLDKALRKEHDAAKALNNAAHNHERIETDVDQARERLNIKKQNEATMGQSKERKQTLLDEVRTRRDQNHEERESRMVELHTHSPTAGSRAGTFNSENGAPMARTASPGSMTAPGHTQASPTAPVETA
ncbi:hypothetical protein OE88DRAFT_1652584 [Heliocybe sulcata]|uniref:Uncharacterized protein n=1 Tax=Heliocybe sulcata TaxID=5364 RepID=A0A5C3NHT1_9AGAM|nr:hypothetical protein OE88DRAFT_1652584 [Heliocybe sulcata]